MKRSNRDRTGSRAYAMTTASSTITIGRMMWPRTQRSVPRRTRPARITMAWSRRFAQFQSDIAANRELSAGDVLFANHVLGRLVVAQALVGGMSHLPGASPLGELHLPDQLRLAEDGALRRWRLGGCEGRGVAAQRPELGLELRQHAIGEAGTRRAGAAAGPVSVIADQQRPDPPLAVALTRQPTSDDDLLAEVVLDLEPGVGPAGGAVGVVERLGRDPLHLHLAARL